MRPVTYCFGLVSLVIAGYVLSAFLLLRLVIAVQQPALIMAGTVLPYAALLLALPAARRLRRKGASAIPDSFGGWRYRVCALAMLATGIALLGTLLLGRGGMSGVPAGAMLTLSLWICAPIMALVEWQARRPTAST